MLVWMWGKRNTYLLLVGVQTGAATGVGFSLEVLQKLELALPCDPSCTTSNHTPKELYILL